MLLVSDIDTIRYNEFTCSNAYGPQQRKMFCHFSRRSPSESTHFLKCRARFHIPLPSKFIAAVRQQFLVSFQTTKLLS
jgi:hypothetical protein